MITNVEQLKQWMDWVENDPKEAKRAIQTKIDGLDGAGPDLVQRARDMYGAGIIESDDLQIDDDAGKAVAADGTWVQAWLWLPNKTCKVGYY